MGVVYMDPKFTIEPFRVKFEEYLGEKTKFFGDKCLQRAAFSSFPRWLLFWTFLYKKLRRSHIQERERES